MPKMVTSLIGFFLSPKIGLNNLKLGYIKKFLKYLGILLFLLIILVVTGAILIQQPRIQTWAANKVLNKIEDGTGAEASLDRIHIDFPKNISLDGFYLEDENGDTLLYAGRLNAGIKFFHPFKRKLDVGTITLNNARIFLNKEANGPYNMEFLLKENKDALNIDVDDTRSKKKAPYDLSVNKLVLNDSYFQMKEAGIREIAPVHLSQLSLDVRHIDLANKSIGIEKILIDQPKVNMESQAQKEKDTRPLQHLIPETEWAITIDEFILKDGSFTSSNHWIDSTGQSIFDPANLQFNDINVYLKNISLDSLLSMEIERVSLNNDSDLNLKNMSGRIAVNANSANIDDLKINFNKSSLMLSSVIELTDFSNPLYGSVQSSVINAQIAAADANLFLPDEQHIDQQLTLRLNSQGSIDDLVINELDAAMNGNRLVATGTIKKVTDPENMIFNMDISNLSASAERIESIAEWLVMPDQIHKLGETQLSGSVSGKINDLSANVITKSNLRELSTEITLKTGVGPIVYQGKFNLPEIDLNQFLPDAKLGQVGGVVEINGSGTNLDELNANVAGELFSLEYNGYTYKQIHFNGQLAEQIFDGNVEIVDECLSVDFDGKVDFSDSIPKIDGMLNIQDADLQTLNFTPKKLIVSLDGDFQVTGSNLDNLNGDLQLNQLHLLNNNAEVDFDTTLLTFRSKNGFKNYDLINEDLVTSVKGNFDPIILAEEMQRFLSNYIYYVNFEDTIPIRNQQVEGTISLAEGFGLTRFFLGNIDLPDNLEASFKFDNSNKILEVDAHSNYVGYNQLGVDTLVLSLTTKGPALMVNANIDRLNLNNSKVKINDIGLVTASTKDYITWNLEVEDRDAPNRISVSPQVEFIGDSIIVHFLDSYLRLNNVNWPFNDNNQIIIKEDAFIAENFSIHNKDQFLEIINASSDLTDVSLEFSGLDLPAFANIVQLDTILQHGYLSGIIRAQDPFQNLSADIGLVFDSLQVFDHFLNQLDIDAFYSKSNNKIELAADFKDPNYDLTAIGSYDLNRDVTNAADLDIDVRRLDLSFIDLILKNETKMDAFGSGQLQFKGSITKPVLLGDAVMLDTATIHINFLGIDIVMIEEKVNFTENTINFKSVNAYDAFGNQGFLEGKLTHYNFKDMSVSASLASDNYNLLNTTIDDNEQFYGRAFGNGSVQFSGLTRNINIEIDMKTMPGTKLSIPLAKAGDTKQYENIIFINPYDSISDDKVNEPIEIKGVNLDFDLEVTPDAELELVLNTETDNNMIAHGHGDLDISIDQNKQLSIYGKYNIRDGRYVFSPQNLLSKRFSILNGSSMNWEGKPFEAELDVEAAYNVKARVDNLLEDTTQSQSQIPMDVIIKIGGTLLDTEVEFDIRTQQTGLTNVPDEVSIFLDDIKDNEGEVTTQAIALLLVGRFLPSNTTVFSGASFSAGDFGKTTAFELISNQISNYLTDAISKLITATELNFAFNQYNNTGIDDEPGGQTTEIQVDITTAVANNRIILKVGGNFEIYDDKSARDNTIAGDFEVEGLLTKDGRLRGKAYHRTADYDIFNQNRSKTGVGLSYQKDFDKIGEVFKPDKQKQNFRRSKRKDRKDRKEDNRINKQRDDAIIKDN